MGLMPSDSYAPSETLCKIISKQTTAKGSSLAQGLQRRARRVPGVFLSETDKVATAKDMTY